MLLCNGTDIGGIVLFRYRFASLRSGFTFGFLLDSLSKQADVVIFLFFIIDSFSLPLPKLVGSFSSKKQLIIFFCSYSTVAVVCVCVCVREREGESVVVTLHVY